MRTDKAHSDLNASANFHGGASTACAWLNNEMIQSFLLQQWCHCISISVKNGLRVVVIDRNGTSPRPGPVAIFIYLPPRWFRETGFVLRYSRRICFFPLKSHRYQKNWYANHTRTRFPRVSHWDFNLFPDTKVLPILRVDCIYFIAMKHRIKNQSPSKKSQMILEDFKN